MQSSSTQPSLFNRLPLAGNYVAAAALALLALGPFLVLTTAISLMEDQLVMDLHATPFELQLTNGMSTAGYAFGAIAAVDVLNRVSDRKGYLLCEAGFVIGSVIALSASEIGQFATGAVLQGLCTGMLLVKAIPPLITGHGASKLPVTGAVISFGLFGVATIGPLVGGTVGSLGGWRPLYAGIAVLATIGLTIGILTFEPHDPPRRGVPFDWLAMPIAFPATALPFFGVSWLTRGSFSDAAFIAPVIVGVLFLLALLVAQYKKTDPLVPVRPLTNTLPVTGTVTAMLGGATFTTLVELTEVYLLRVPHYSPVRIGALFTPAVAGVAVAAIALWRLLPTRFTPYLALSGLLSLGVAGAILLALSSSNASIVVPIAAVLLGYGAGAGVVPGLFLGGLAVHATQIGATFAMVELLRSEAAFLVGPIMLKVALTRGDFENGYDIVAITMIILVSVGGLALTSLWLLGGVRNTGPDLEAWVTGKSTGYHSPPLVATIRKVCRLD